MINIWQSVALAGNVSSQWASCFVSTGCLHQIDDLDFYFFFAAEITNYYRKLASTKKESICEDPPYIIDVSENQKKERVKS